MSKTPVYFLSHGGPKTIVKPKAVVVFSAHWQASSDNEIEINTQEKTDLIYDFYGFPSHYYKVSRGLDHGVWASFKCAFAPDENPLSVPLVQVSLFSSEDPTQHYNLGRAIASLRSDNIAIIVSGMAVHNLRDIRLTFANPERIMPYTSSFDEALKDAATSAPAEREQKMVALLKRPDARQAHPTFEHLLPIFVGAGAAGDDVGKRLL
ncbi:4,5-DOPA dioxygenase extradiol, partial [Lecanoromycetidae sp. Uapishka_2]